MNKSPKIKIFVAHHKPWYAYEDDVYVPIQVGKKNAKVDLWIIWDDTWDNISEKNSSYAELTAQYRVWKNYNLKDVDYVWFCHYRRYMTYCYKPSIFNYLFAKNFYSPLEGKWPFIWKIVAFKDHHCLTKYNKNVLIKNSLEIKNFIKNNEFDIYVPKMILNIRAKLWSYLWKKSTGLITFGNANESAKNGLLMKECENLFYEIYPEQKKVKKNLDVKFQDYCWLWRHIFIMKKKLFFNYMEWMFTYLFEIEKMIKEKKLNINEHWAWKDDWRFMWIFSEPLINYWIDYMENKENIRVSYWSNILMFTDYYI